jgi:hypothetical protein
MIINPTTVPIKGQTQNNHTLLNTSKINEMLSKNHDLGG